MNYKSFALLALCLVVPGCSGDNVNSAVSQYCDCAQPMIDKSDEMMKSMQSGNFAKLTEMAQNLEAQGKELQACMTKLEQKYQSKMNDAKFKSEVMAGVKEKCPFPHQKANFGVG